jgi:hypothetical protein
MLAARCTVNVSGLVAAKIKIAAITTTRTMAIVLIIDSSKRA